MRYGNYVLSNCKYPPPPPKKRNFNFKGIRTTGLCISTAVPYYFSYEDPYIESRPLLTRTEWHMEVMYTVEIQIVNEDMIVAVLIAI